MTNLFQIMQTINQFQQFAEQFKKTKQDPQTVIDQLVQSGKVTQEQLNQATQMANTFKSILGGK